MRILLNNSMSLDMVLDIVPNDPVVGEEEAIEQELLSTLSEHISELGTHVRRVTGGSHVKEIPPPNKCIVDRYDVMTAGMRCFRDPTFNPHARLDTKFAGEDGWDGGALFCEFMTLATQAISALPLFVGRNPTSRDLSLDAIALKEGTYSVIGKMLAFFVVHKGPLPRFFSPLLYNMVAQEPEVELSLEDLYLHDEDLAARVEQISSAKTNKEYIMAVENLRDVIEIAGCSMLTLSMRTQRELIDALLQFVLVGRLQPALNQLCTGLNTLGVLDCIRKHPKVWKLAFTAPEKPPRLKASDIVGLFDVMWSEKEIEKLTIEERVHGYWLDFVQEREDAGQLDELLCWLTGLREMPILGFRSFLQMLTFNHPSEVEPGESATLEYPVIETCNICLRLPLSPNYQDFREHFLAALKVRSFPLY